MKKTSVLSLLIAAASFACDAAEMVVMPLEKAVSAEAVERNKAYWSVEISRLKNGKADFYFLETDLTSLGKKDLITVMENDEVCGMRNCPMKIVTEGTVVLQAYIPLSEGALLMKKPKRGFFPDVYLNGEQFTYLYDLMAYRTTRELTDGSGYGEASDAAVCKKCSAADVPKNPVKDKEFAKFEQEIKYEVAAFTDAFGLGQYRLSKMALSRIGYVAADNLANENGEYAWTKKAGRLGIKTNADFSGNLQVQERIFREYVGYLHSLALDRNALTVLCKKVTDVYGRTAEADYWGILKGIYMSGIYAVLYGDADVSKQILDGTALANKCLKKIITGSIIKENMLSITNGCMDKEQRGKIE